MNKDTEKRIQRLFDGVVSSLQETDPEFTEIILNFSQNEVIEANKLTEKEQMFCILSVLLGCQGMKEFQDMLHAALNTGIDPIAVKEIIYQATAYLGIGRTHDFLIAANQIMEQHDIQRRLLLRRQQRKNRFGDGLTKQVKVIRRGYGKTTDRRPCSSPKYQPLAGR